MFEQQVPVPFIFNPLKHHAGYIRSFITNCQTSGIAKNLLDQTLIKIGNCMLDLYFGDLEIVEIISEIKQALIHQNIFNQDAYSEYISRLNCPYQNIDISDGSTWTLLIGYESGRYLHIHPARGSKYTVRVKAIALKTALIMKMFYANELEAADLIELTNKVRDHFLGESPIKNLTYTRGIRRALHYL